MITAGEIRRAQRNAKSLGLQPGLIVDYRDPNTGAIYRGTLLTVPGIGNSEGPYCRVNRSDSYSPYMISVNMIVGVHGPDLTDANALLDWLDS